MKLVIATPLYPPEIGGPATYAKILSEGLPRKGIEVSVVKFSDVRHLPKPLSHYVYYRRVLKAARQADIVLALDPVSVGLPAMKAAKKADKPFVVKIVGDYAWEQGRQRFGVTAGLDDLEGAEMPFPVRALQQVQTRVAVAATRVIVPSEYLETVVSKWGIPANKISVIYNAVQLPELPEPSDAALSLPRPRIVSVGRLVPWKHFDAVIDAIAALRARGVQASLVIIGDGPLHGTLTNYAEDKLGDSCRILGMLPHASALAIMQRSDVFVLNSSYEGLSHTLIEALTLGVPVVATDIPGNKEVVIDNEDGLLVRSGDTQALAGAIERICTDRTLRDQLVAHTRTSAQRFSTEAMLQATTTLLQNL